MTICETNETGNIRKLLDEAEGCRLGINGDINVINAVEILKSNELNNSDFALATVRMLEEFKNCCISESLFTAIRNMALFLMRSKKFSVSNSAFNMMIDVDGKTDIQLIENGIDSVLTSLIGEIRCKKSRDDKISECLNNTAPETDIVFFENVTDDIFENIDDVRNSFEKTAEICKILFVKHDVAEKLRTEYSSFYYQTIGHTLSNHPSATFKGYTEIYLAFMSALTQKHNVTPGFSVAINEYIDAVYPTADLQGKAFIDDLIKRVEQQMLTTPYLPYDESGYVITEDGVPYSRKVEERKNEANTEKEDITADSYSQEADNDIQVTSPEELTVPHEMNICVQKNAPKNILLLSLSTFGQMKENKFQYTSNGKTYECNGIYQLDPVPKVLSDVLGDNSQYLDEIIMLATEETLKNAPRKITVNGEEKNINCSPEQFFKCQVKNYLRPLPDGSDTDIDNDKRFKTVKIEDINNPSKEIKETVEYIRNQFIENDNNVNLYIDAHGSLRGLSLAMLAINSLLLNEKKGAEKVFSIELGENIIFEDNADKLFSFVSGLNEFRSFGRIDSLEKYMEGTAEELTGPMKLIAEAVSVCNIDRFEGSLKKIRKYFNKEEKKPTDNKKEKENYLSIFENAIKEDYGKLLYPYHTVFDEIEWCLNKKLYQAVLTIVESKVPSLIFGNSDYGTDKERQIFDAELPLFILGDNIKKEWIEDSTVKDSFADWITQKIYYTENKKKKYYNDHFKFDKMDTVLNAWSTAGIAPDCQINGKLNGYKEDVNKFILLLRILKTARNSINHINGDIPETVNIHEATKKFLKSAKNLSEILAEDFIVEGFTNENVPIGTVNNKPSQITKTSYCFYIKNHECKIGDVLKVAAMPDGKAYYIVNPE